MSSLLKNEESSSLQKGTSPLQMGTSLTPKVQPDGSMYTGCAIIVEELPLPDGYSARPLMYGLTEDDLERGVLFKVMTDFGNVMQLLPSEVRIMYSAGRVDNVKERIKVQLGLLQEVCNGLEE